MKPFRALLPLLAVSTCAVPAPATLRPSRLNRLGERPAIVAAAIAFTQDLTNNRVYQRSTLTGGGQGKGQGSIAVPVTLGSVSPIYAQLRAEDGVTVLQSLGQVATSQAAGTGTLTLSGVDARLGWMKVALSTDGTNWVVGGTRVGMGRVIAMAGRSLAVRCLAKLPADSSGTDSSLGVTISPYGAFYISYIFDSNERTVSTPYWTLPSESGDYDGTCGARLLNLEVAYAGVNTAIAGHVHGGTAISVFLPGASGTDDDTYYANLDTVGGFEAGIFWGSNTDSNTAPAVYLPQVTQFWTATASHNPIFGGNFDIVLVPNGFTVNADATGAGSTQITVQSRAAFNTWASQSASAYKSATVAQIMDHQTQDNVVHENQVGGIVVAQHLARATRVPLGLAHSDKGGLIYSASLSGSTLTVHTTLAPGATGYTGVNSPQKLAWVYPRGTTATSGAYTVNSVSFGTGAAAGDIILALASAPSGGTGIDFYWNWHTALAAGDYNAGVYDDVTDGDGITVGRAVQQSLQAMQVNYTGKAGVDLTTTGTVTYAAAKFGNGFNTSAGVLTAGASTDGLPAASTWSVCAIGKASAAPTDTNARYIAGQNGKFAFGIAKDGKPYGTITTGTSTTTTFGTSTAGIAGAASGVDNTPHLYCMVAKGSAGYEVRQDGVAFQTGAQIPTTSAATGAFFIGGPNATANQFLGTVDEVSLWYTAIDASYVPTSAYVGNEQGIIALYHGDSATTAATP